MPSYLLINTVTPIYRAGDAFDEAPEQGAILAGIIQLGGVVVPLPNPALEVVAGQAQSAYARGAAQHGMRGGASGTLHAAVIRGGA